MKIGILLEGKNPPDKRVPFTPNQCAELKARYPGLELVVQESPIRAFDDSLYENLGIEVQEELDNQEVLFGVKEVNLEDLQPHKKYFFFSHTIKKQPYNRELLKTVLDRKIQLVDYECLTEKSGRRLVGFGRYAGIVGCYNAFLAYGKRSNSYSLKPAHQCNDRIEMESQLPKIELPNNYKIVLTGLGRVAGGAVEILKKMNVREVSPKAFLSENFAEPVFTQLSVSEYFRKKNGSSFERREVYEHPERFEPNFFGYASQADMYIPCHFWDSKGPVIFSKEDMKQPNFRIRLIADISCDIDGPIPSTLRPSTIANPIYQYEIDGDREVTEVSEDTITVMAVDNLPCELPKDASEDFGSELMQNVIPSLMDEDKDQIIERATIAKGGKLTAPYQYLQGYVNGED